jgi:hypothetical protein
MARFPVQRIASGQGVSVNQARNQLAGNDRIEWSALPFQNGTPLVYSTDPATGIAFVRGQSQSGRSYSITHPLDLIRLTQGPGQAGWLGNFNPGEPLLFTNDRPPSVAGRDPFKESIIIHFPQPVRGVGMQLQGLTLNNKLTGKNELQFNANILFWHANRTDWGQPDPALGLSTNSNDGSAVFLAATVANPIISTVQVYVEGLNTHQIDFAIGTMNVLN